MNLVALTSEPVHVDVRMFASWQTMSRSTNFIYTTVCALNNADMVTAQNIEVMSRKFRVLEINTTGKCPGYCVVII
jgi:hypothetical protein